MRLVVLFLVFLPFLTIGQEKWAYEHNQTYTHSEIVIKYGRIQSKSQVCSFTSHGVTDAGIPLKLFVIDKDKQFNPVPLNQRKKPVVFILNGIHPGEPCGIDASLKLAWEFASGDSLAIPNNVTICIIPIYNIDGAINRGCCSRANQNGPEEYGFRGNGQNLDLNRDFVKMDSRNAQSLVQLIAEWQPDVFVDTHISNGADYQHVMTHISSQLSKMDSTQADFMKNRMEPYLYQHMERNNYPMCPYVNTRGQTPESGIVDYLETPRYASGFANLFGALSFVSETHMLKPYQQQVEATEHFLRGVTEFANNNAKDIIQYHQSQSLNGKVGNSHPLNWELDSTVWQDFEFLGFAAEYKPSEITGQPRLYYNQSKPWKANVRWYREYIGQQSVTIPQAYIIPQSWYRVIERLQFAGVQMRRLDRDTLMLLEVYRIELYQTVKSPYEGHYLHYNVEVDKKLESIQLRAGDFLINTDQTAWRFIVESLEPQGEDSFFAWNFFDGILMQKEWFSSYVFEDVAAELLKNDKELNKAFNLWKSNGEKEKSAFDQLYWIYKRSSYYEPSVNRYPVYRIP